MLIPALILCAIMAAATAWLFWTVPEGWQDADGFHLGRQPDPRPRNTPARATRSRAEPFGSHQASRPAASFAPFHEAKNDRDAR